jgi:hypothetical protein
MVAADDAADIRSFGQDNEITLAGAAATSRASKNRPSRSVESMKRRECPIRGQNASALEKDNERQ